MDRYINYVVFFIQQTSQELHKQVQQIRVNIINKQTKTYSSICISSSYPYMKPSTQFYPNPTNTILKHPNGNSFEFKQSSLKHHSQSKQPFQSIHYYQSKVVNKAEDKNQNIRESNNNHNHYVKSNKQFTHSHYQSEQGTNHAQSYNAKLSTNPTTCFSPSNLKYYFQSWLLFIISFIIFLLIWIISHFSIQRITNSYYFNDYRISPYSSLALWNSFLTNPSPNTYTIANSLYTRDDLLKPDSIALALFFSWILWKLPLTIFTFIINIKLNTTSTQKYSTFTFFILLLLLIDIMATAFKPQSYQDWIFFLIYTILSITLLIANGLKNKNKMLKSIKNFLLPILYITFAYISFTLFIPGIYHAIYNHLGQDAPYIIAHLFPAFDLIFYSLIICITYFCDSHTLKFVKLFHFLNIGYLLGHIVLFSPQDVEFYYMVGYLALRNLSFNWIHGKVQKYVIVPCAQPGWLMMYLVSLCVNFIPFVGFGKLVISRSFYSQILQLTVPIQSYILQSQLYAYPPVTVPSLSTFNPSLKSNIQISSIFIIWVISTISQKYHISKISYAQVFFYIFGLYMFYFGLATGIQLEILQANSL